MSVNAKTARTEVAAACAAGLLLAIPSSAGATPGDLDPAFGVGGKVITDVMLVDLALAVVLQADGKIVAAGAADVTNNSDFALARYNQDGSVDTSFGSGGKVTTDFSSSNDRANGLVIQPDGKLLAAGTVGFADFAIARYNIDGSLDTSFGSGGKVTTDFAGGTDAINAVVLQPDGKIVAAGHSCSGQGCVGPSLDFALARYNQDGSLDPSFGTGGKVTTDFAGAQDTARGLVLQPDGRLVAAGSAITPGFDFALARYNQDGSLHTSFGNGGKVTTDLNGDIDEIQDLRLQSDGKLVATGNTNTSVFPFRFDFALARYNPSGSLDTSFGSGGKVTTDLGGSNDAAFGLVIQPDGKPVAAGVANPVLDDEFALARYNVDGSLDSTFASGGKVTTDFGPSHDGAFALAAQLDGKLVAAGHAGFADFALARYLDSAPTVPICNGKPATIVGPPGDSTVVGTAEADVIVDLSGNNKIRARGGNDTICTGPGNDEISGAGGGDWVDAGDGRNSVEGNAGDDRLTTRSGDDELEGNAGNDTLTGGAGADRLRGGGGTDTATDFTSAEGDTRTGVEVVL